jgi:hypothetical protein
MASKLVQVLGLGIILTSIFLCAFWGWKRIWFDNFGAEMPIDRSFQKDSKQRLLARTKTLKIFWSMLRNLAFKLDMQYFTTHIGNDGYLYLLLQRNIGLLSLKIGIISFALSIIMNIILEDETQKDFVANWLDVTFLDNKKLTNYRPWFHVFMVLVYSLLTINMVKQTRKLARESYRFSAQ